jgi:hypothetical protein
MDTNDESVVNPTAIGPPTAKLKPERVQEELRTLPNWQLDSGGQAIESTREFPCSRVAGMFGAWVVGLSGALGLTASVSLAHGRIRVQLSSPIGLDGLTQGVFDLARQIG